ncbi:MULTISPECIES: diguanylate cyclase domain-containing protein [unclassified Modestobacter]|uniref:diguanylate cyclase domain-containing protein n=1 Tax=unclassified Modestobacter TaxID=2643866 RepID=UPI0022AAFC5C|nr:MULTISPECIES: diguanylate cyclase [unclassified Modestobacter]MCZ2825061.1 diguanylate cyclase [Modestobacter sp. VKM Ac-2981]MCZ2854436.1 diguanylate cyclase [Modestobacter sp. VKM Ac-2982]
MTSTHAPVATIDAVLAAGSVHSLYQPIVELDSGRVVAYEALARGPQGPLYTPDALFAAARSAGRLAELDALCRSAALRGAVAAELGPPLTVFVNVEPQVLESAPLEELLAIATSAPAGLRVVVEITERALATRPADLLRAVERVREVGWGIALDDVGAESMSLAFMPLLRPDVVKLDLRLVQQRPGPAVAEIMNAVNGYAERTGALILAEGIEDEAHLAMARALGASLGQGWYFGRPAATAAPGRTVGRLDLPSCSSSAIDTQASPFSCLLPGTQLRTAPKALLIELSKHLERQAMRLGETCVVAATFQEARHFTPATSLRYRDLVARTGFVAALGEDLPIEPVPGVRGAHLAADDPVRGEWDVVVLSPHFSAALLARDLGDTGPDLQRRYEYALTYDRHTVERAGVALVARVAAQPAPELPVADRPAPAAGAAITTGATGGTVEEALLRRALAATTSGVTIADMTAPDQPLVYVNAAFEQLAGLEAGEVLGRNCRFLQGQDTDPGTVDRMRLAIREGAEFRATLLNHRGPDREPWWNEIHLAPVLDTAGDVIQYIGVQTDVTGRVTAERELLRERDRTRQHLAQIEELAYKDPLTALPNRRRFEERMESALWQARLDGSAVALLFLDLDGFKAVNDALGHAAGDELLQVVADRLRGRLRRGDLLARLGGDEFLVGLLGLDPSTALREAGQVAQQLVAAVTEPVVLGARTVQVQASVGISVHPDDGAEFGPLLHRADARMYAAKHPAGA